MSRIVRQVPDYFWVVVTFTVAFAMSLYTAVAVQRTLRQRPQASHRTVAAPTVKSVGKRVELPVVAVFRAIPLVLVEAPVDSSLTVKQLRAIAANRNIRGSGRMRKADLLEALNG